MALKTATLKPEGKKALDSLLERAVDSKNIPAAFFGATNADEEIYFNCRGDKVFGRPEEGPVTPDTTLQLFSMTKFVTAIACWQQVDKGVLSMDDPALIEKHCPELWQQPILEGYSETGEAITKPRQTPLTLRHLLTHTSGLSYSWNAPDVERWRKEHSVPEMFAPHTPLSAYVQPLIFEPGTSHRYSIGIDWAGILVTRVTGKNLEQVFQENIFAPCGIKNISFIPTKAIKDRLMAMTTRTPQHTGEVTVFEGNFFGRSLQEEDYGTLFSGGGGLFGTARDYLTFLRHVLASADPATPKPLISAASFKKLFQDHLDEPPAIREQLAKMAKQQDIHDEALLDGGKGTFIGHSPGLFINKKGSKYGRKAMSGYWDGAAKTFFWLDPTSGLGAVCCTNIVAHNPEPWTKVYNEYERTLYDNLV
ncbi:beta-lactamase/transpeptidase-like protein [Naematelia encephala]|uniref:Beta-lactamase/transpeptidase-like protein n=1 Tax=Naematelia encephala TaxID=71784 RepID=A0A1Y2BAZ1_9TREE|nr:beta-lactamase/transpeptidase-like protein [Naematelia encephala]